MKTLQLSIFAIILLTSTALMAQTEDTLSYPEHEIRKNLSIYQLAKSFNDPVIARMALYQTLIYTGNQGAILDSLALNYYQSSNFVSSALIAKEAVAANPTNQFALEIAAISFNSLGAKEQALTYFEKLFLTNDNTSTLYQMAFVQYELKRYKESTASVEILLKRADVDGLNMLFKKVDGSNQEISMRAALTNLKGLIASAEGNKSEAQKLFLEALKLAPGFELAQANLKQLGE